MSRKPTATITTPISPEAATESALENLIYNTYAYLKVTESRRDEAIRDIQKYAEYLSRRYAEIAERAAVKASPGSFDISLSASNQTQLSNASANYQIQTDLLTEQRRLLKRLLACTTTPWPDQITYAANQGEN